MTVAYYSSITESEGEWTILRFSGEKKPKPTQLDHQACSKFSRKCLQRQNVIVFKTSMEKTHMKELRTLKILKW